MSEVALSGCQAQSRHWDPQVDGNLLPGSSCVCLHEGVTLEESVDSLVTKVLRVRDVLKMKKKKHQTFPIPAAGVISASIIRWRR